MIDEEFKIKVAEHMGATNQCLKDINDHLKTLNGSVAKVTKKVNAHEVILGKVGFIFTIVVVGITTAFQFVASWIKGKFGF